jgi:hypothetical protein
VACPDCDWLAAAPDVPQSCEQDYRHAGPQIVVALQYCERCAWECESTEELVCTGDSDGDPHEVLIDLDRSRFQ